jgi:demethylmenaquinone methyltransferase/2-methoxy-6-polyprenyl-1,4-benzoquinol methylase
MHSAAAEPPLPLLPFGHVAHERLGMPYPAPPGSLSPSAPPAGGVPEQVAYTRDASIYDSRTSTFDTYRRQLVDLLPLRPGDVVLDVGCGTGLCFEQVRDRIGAEGAIVGVDTSREMLEVAAARVAARGWRNVLLVQSAVEQAELPAVDHVLFCATHDVLQSDAALDNVLAHVRDGGTVAATGGKWAPPWAIALNAGILALHAPYVRNFTGFDRPWNRLESRLERLRVREVAMGGGYLASGTVPSRIVPLGAGPLDRESDDAGPRQARR